MTQKAKLIAKTNAARVFLNQLFTSLPSWKGEWFVLQRAKVHMGQTGTWMLIAPVGHPWDKQERWVDAGNDKHFNVLVMTC